MILLSVLLGLTIVFLLLAFMAEQEWAFFLAIIAGCCFGILLLAFPINYYETKESIYGFTATASTLEMARKQGNVLENAALQQKIIEQNQWLAKAQYYKTTMWSIWVPKDVNKLQPIK